MIVTVDKIVILKLEVMDSRSVVDNLSYYCGGADDLYKNTFMS